MKLSRPIAASLAVSLCFGAAPAQACGPSDPLSASLFISIMPSIAFSEWVEGSMNSLRGGGDKVTVKRAEKSGDGVLYALENPATGMAAQIRTHDKREPVAVGTTLTLET